MIYPAPAKIVYCYEEYQQLFNQYPHIEFHKGLPNIGTLTIENLR